MDQSMRKYMRVGIILHVAYNGLAGGDGPILKRQFRTITLKWWRLPK